MGRFSKGIEKVERMAVNMRITIGRQCGCNADLIGEKLAKRLGLTLYNKKAIQKLADEKGVYERYPNYFGEKDADPFLVAIVRSEQNDTAMKTPGKALHATIGDEPCVIIGRCGNYVYGQEPDTVTVFLSGDKKTRVRTIMEKHSCSEMKAKQLVEKTDARRRAYHEYYCNQAWGEAANYNLCLDESVLGVDGVVEMICRYVELAKLQ